LIAALLHTPKVLFLDEPTIGLDVVMQKKVREFIKEYNQRYDAAVLLTSHYMDDVREICKRVIMINHGEIIFDGSLKKLVDTYAKEKNVTVIFDKTVSREKLEGIAKIESSEGPKVTFRVPRNKVSHVASELLNKFEVDDLEITEQRLEDVIPQVLG